VILVDTSVWVDHLREGDKALASLLEAGTVLIHPFVIGELALGNLRQREIVLNALADLPQVSVATHAEVLHFVDQHLLFRRGVGYVDAHLLAAAQLTPGAALWTNDKRLHGVADRWSLAISPSWRGSYGVWRGHRARHR
jgi:predicted nucleic acid-binding protein